MLEDLRGYIQMASGLTEVTAAKARDVAMSLVNQGLSLTTKAPDVVGQVQEMADDLVSTSKTNREMLIGLIRTEVDRAVGRMGFVREDELAALRRRVEHLEESSASSSPSDNRAKRPEKAPTEQSSEQVSAKPAAKPAAKKKKVVVPSESAGGS